MDINQLSVFIENKSGRLNEVMDILGEHQINVAALCIADTSDYGIVRMIVSDTEKAVKLLKEQAFSVQITPVICCKIANKPGGLKTLLNHLTAAGISLEYMYTFSSEDEAYMVLRIEERQRAIECLEKHGIEIMTKEILNGRVL